MKTNKIPLYLKQLFSGERKLHLSFDYVNDKDPFSPQNFGINLLNGNIPLQLKKNNSKMYQLLVTTDGIGACTGSSALTDFMGEFSCCTSIGGVDSNENPARGGDNGWEVDFFRDSHGLYELEKICDFDGNRICEGAIRDFIEKVRVNYLTGISFYKDNYLQASRDFLLDILDFYFQWDNVSLELFCKKMSKDTYREYAKKYCTKLLKDIPSERILVMDNICSISNPKNDVLTQYFGNYKVLASIRDPRDVYSTARLYPTWDLGYIPKDPYLFIKYYKWYIDRYQYQLNPNVLFVRFEDLVLQYDQISKQIMNFIGLSEEEHIHKKEYFNPDISKNNIGIYRKLSDKNAIKIIEDNLSDYLYKK